MNIVKKLVEMRFICNIIMILFISTIALAEINSTSSSEETFLSADYVEYNQQENFITAEGNIIIKFDPYILSAKQVLYDIERDLLWAKGNVRINDHKGKIAYGDLIFFKDKFKIGIIHNFAIKFSDNNTILAAKLAKRLNENESLLEKARFTPCDVNCGKNPLWQISARKTDLDLEKQRITYENVFFELYGTPIFFTPYFSHPTPNASAQTGFLVPEIKKNNLRFPFYYRAQPNLDITITPRIDINQKLKSKYSIFEVELRHKLNNGDYIIQGSYGKTPYSTRNASGEIVKDTKPHRYHIFTAGNFSYDEYKYGFDLNRTSDKAYLKNYYDNYSSYLTSKLYTHKAEEANYVAVEGLYFQGLGALDSSNTNPLILPYVKTKNIFYLNEEETFFFSVEDNSLLYKERSGKEVSRTSNKFSLTNNFITENGHLISIAANNRVDLYHIRNTMPHPTKGSKVMARNIPEAEGSWRYPLISALTTNSSLLIEPITKLVVGEQYKDSYKNYKLIDAQKYELSEDNLFNSNRYSGVDYHEFGNRLSYGINSIITNKDNNYLNIFLGELRTKNNANQNNNGEKVGKLGFNLNNNVSCFYRFRKNKKFKPIRDEIIANYQNEKVYASTSFIALRNIQEYFSTEHFSLLKNKIRQNYYDVDYKLNSNWMIGNQMRVDFSGRQPQLLYKSIKVTYTNECVKIAAKISDDYTYDGTRSIKKTRSKTISVGLKVLNM